MSTIVCAITGNVPDEPVFSPKTGHVYEKRIILKHVESAGKCPVTKQEISADDLVDVKVNKAVRPRPAAAASIPGMLSMLQNEWDALMSETYELKSHLDTTRKQLSHALYQHDAACRVIARLLRERDAARAQVSQLQDQLSNMQPSARPVEQHEEVAETGLTPEIIARMTDVAKGLSRTRKKRDFTGLTPIAEVKKFECTGSHPIHQSTAPGILCLDVHKTDDRRILTGGVDQQVILFNGENERTAQKLVGHTKRVGSVLFHPTKDIVLSASQDATARVWTCTDAGDWKAPYSAGHVIRKHKEEVTDLSVHPLGDIISTASRDRSWALHDLSTGRCVRHVQDLSTSYGCFKFHPDGLILGGGSEGKTVELWDIKDQITVANLTGHEGEVDAISFSENAYYLASASRDGTVKLWDLRKPVCIQTVEVGGPAHCVRFDYTGQYLAVGASSVRIYNFATKTTIQETIELKDHAGAVMDVCFGTLAKSVASVSMDRTLRLYTVK